MKNTIKRVLLLIPVISVLLVALAVPAFADATDGGYIEPVTFDTCRYTVGGSLSDYRTVNVTLGAPVSLEGGDSYLFSYLLVVDVDSLSGVTFDTFSYNTFAIRSVIDGYSSSDLVSSLRSDGTKLICSLKRTTSGSTDTFNISFDGLQSLEILCTEDLLPYLTNVDYTYYTVDPSPVDGFTSVWTDIMTWITSALTLVMGAFYVDGSLTLLGTLAVIGVSVGICFLLIGLIQRFLHLRG